jgi:hypothetical protein
MKPTTISAVVSAMPSTTMPPTTTMPWMKFEPDIKGVCRMAGTRRITSIPVNAASMKIYSAIQPSIVCLPRFRGQGEAG